MRRDYGEAHEYVIVNGKKHYVVYPRKPSCKICGGRHHSYHHNKRPADKIHFKLGGGI